jgi:S1-C subfamily serine protease
MTDEIASIKGKSGFRESHSQIESAKSALLAETVTLRRVARTSEVIATGLMQGGQKAFDELQKNPLQLPAELISGSAIGAGIAWLSRRNGLLGFAGHATSAAMGIGFVCDVFSPQRWQKFGSAVNETWNALPTQNLSNQKKAIAESIGQPLTHASIVNLSMLGTAGLTRAAHLRLNTRHQETDGAGFQGKINCSTTAEVKQIDNQAIKYSWRDGKTEGENTQLLSQYEDTVNSLLPKVLPGLVKVVSPNINGTGFAIGNGLIATNQHLMPLKGMTCKVVLLDGTESKARSVWEIPKQDLVFLKVLDKSVAEKLQPLKLLTSIKERQEPLVAFGFPKSELHAAPGPLRLLAPWDMTDPNTFWISTEAGTRPGFSGGPLVDAVGNVIGLSTCSGPGGGTSLLAKHITEGLSDYAKTKIDWYNVAFSRSLKGSLDDGHAYTSHRVLRPSFEAEPTFSERQFLDVQSANVKVALARYAVHKGDRASAAYLYEKANECPARTKPQWLQEYASILDTLGRRVEAATKNRYSRYAINDASNYADYKELSAEQKLLYARSWFRPGRATADEADRNISMGLMLHKVPELTEQARVAASETLRRVPRDSTEHLQALVLAGDAQRLNALTCKYLSQEGSDKSDEMQRAAKAAIAIYRKAWIHKENTPSERAQLNFKIAETVELLGKDKEGPSILRSHAYRSLEKEWGSDPRLLPYLDVMTDTFSGQEAMPYHQTRLRLLEQLYGKESQALASALYDKLYDARHCMTKKELFPDVQRFKSVEINLLDLNVSPRWKNIVDWGLTGNES